MAKVKNADGLSGSQVIILNLLAKQTGGVGLTDDEIAHLGRVPVNVQTLGPVFEDAKTTHPNSLRGRGLVVCEKLEGDEPRWFITPKGRDYGTKMKGRRIGPDNKVPPEILDPVVMAIKKTRAYGLEQYTEADLVAIRTKLPQEYKELSVARMGELHNQILARRKQGAYSDPNEKLQKALEKLLREFGPTGTFIPEFLTEEQVQDVYSRLGQFSGEGE